MSHSQAWEPQWQSDSKLAALKDNIIYLEVRISNGRLYAIRGEFEVRMRFEAGRFLEHGIMMPRREGF